MPGAFHTELLPVGDRELQVYLLDMKWSNPSVKDSTVKLTYLNGGKSSELACAVKSNFFQCQLGPDATLQKGKLKVQATREKASGVEVVYDLPFRLTIDEHAGHH
jgi:hypothetical protein